MNLNLIDLNSHRSSPDIVDIVSLFACIPSDFSERVSFNQAFQWRPFQLGEELWCSSPIPDERAYTGPPSAVVVLYQGRGRLLCKSAYQSRETSAGLIEPGEPFGNILSQDVPGCPYRVVGASEGVMAWISYQAIYPWLEQLPEWAVFLNSQLELRDRLIFFKTQTAFHRLTSQQIKAFVSLLETQHLDAGTPLTALNLDQRSRYWLRSGEINSAAGQPPVPEIGTVWGYPDSVSPRWVAHTPLWVYQLPQHQWERAHSVIPASAIPEVLDSPSPKDHLGNSDPIRLQTSRRIHRKQQPDNAKAREQLKRDQPALAAPSASAAEKPHRVLFPKPQRRHFLNGLNRYPWIAQQSSSDCGVACVAMITQYWGKKLPIYLLRELGQVERTGTSLNGVAKIAERIGFQAQPIRASFDKLVEQSNPWIGNWQGNHYVVVYHASKHRVLIADPALGKRSLSRSTFMKQWTGHGVLMTPNQNFRQITPQTSALSLGRFLQLLTPHQGLGLQVISLSLLLQMLGLVTPLFTQVILDQVIVQQSFSTLHVFSMGALLFGLWGIGLTAARQYLLSYFSNRLDLTLISGFINHALKLPLKFFESRRVGDILTRIQENSKIQRFLLGQVLLAWLDLVMGFVYLALMFYYNWRLSLLVLALIPPIIVLTLGATPFLRKLSREIFNEMAENNSILVELFSGITAIKTAGVEQEFRWQWEEQFTRSINARFRGQKFGITLQTLGGVISTLGSLGLMWYGAILVIQGQLSIGQFIAFNMLVGQVIRPFLVLANFWDELQEIFIAIERLNDVFASPPEESAQQLMVPLPPIQGEVRFEDVTFRYSDESERNTLQNLSFGVQSGETIAIVGRSGSGKSTLVKLLQGFYHPNSGRICMDGHDIAHVSPASLRSQLGVVPQECFLFSGSIIDNITLFRPEFTLEKVIEASKLAEAHGFIENLPFGYNTQVGERGATLSGGQRQRIAIARALLNRPRMLILDEATSSLDTESERRFQRNLGLISRDRTTFIIAHRLSTICSADSILVLDQGVLVEQGSHETLLAARGLYYYLAQEQINL
jgi:ATP-binding cassette subfamily B protein